MATTPSLITDYSSAHCDGEPGLEYFAENVAFAWTGNSGDPIEISNGAYGEAVAYLLDVRTALAPPLGLREALDWFAQVCDEWLSWARGCDQTPLPIRTELDTHTSAGVQHFIDTGVFPVRMAR